MITMSHSLVSTCKQREDLGMEKPLGYQVNMEKFVCFVPSTHYGTSSVSSARKDRKLDKESILFLGPG